MSINIDTLYDVTDIMRIFKCQESKARAIMRNPSFPVMTIGREKRVVPSELDKWIRQNATKQIKAT